MCELFASLQRACEWFARLVDAISGTSSRDAAPDAPLQIHRNNFILRLTEVLASSHPAGTRHG